MIQSDFKSDYIYWTTENPPDYTRDVSILVSKMDNEISECKLPSGSIIHYEKAFPNNGNIYKLINNPNKK